MKPHQGESNKPKKIGLSLNINDITATAQMFSQGKADVEVQLVYNGQIQEITYEEFKQRLGFNPPTPPEKIDLLQQKANEAGENFYREFVRPTYEDPPPKNKSWEEWDKHYDELKTEIDDYDLCGKPASHEQLDWDKVKAFISDLLAQQREEVIEEIHSKIWAENEELSTREKILEYLSELPTTTKEEHHD